MLYADGSEWCTCPREEGSKFPPGVVRPRRTPEERARDEAEGKG
jgi:hypothetical protein